MGYSHYHYHTRPISDGDWARCCDALAVIVEAARKAGLLLSSADWRTALSNHDYLTRAWLHGHPDHGQRIRLNGVDETSCETFIFWQNAVPHASHVTPLSAGFQAVKTNRQPYDVVITAFYCWLTSQMPTCLDRLESDGRAPDWKAGHELAQSLFPEITITNPMD